jgi:type I site-specific restriction endonuclease
MAAPASIRFHRGTLEVGAGVPDIEGALWDHRSSTRRVAAYRFAELIRRADDAAQPLEGDLRAGWQLRPRDPSALGLRPYQQQAIAAWSAFGRRGVVVLPTGAGKTR